MSVEPPPIARPRRRIVTDAYCHRCGYDLRGVEVDDSDNATCPECAALCNAYYLLDRPRGPCVNTAQWTVAASIGAMAAFVLGYRLLSVAGLKQTAALFVGLPAIVAIIVTLAPRSRTATGIAVKAVTICLLVSGIFLGEGLVCVLMISPIFYLAGIGIGLIIDYALRNDDRQRVSRIRLRCWIAVPVLLLSLEGVSPPLSFPRQGVVSRSAIVEAPAAAVETALASSPSFDAPLPLYFRMGFPRPVGGRGRGLDVGDERVIQFMTLEQTRGDLLLRVVERDQGSVVFDTFADTSKISDWMGWGRVEVTWSAVGVERTRVTWRIGYERRLDPAWYFAPWQRYAVGLAADYLIESIATPREE